MATPRRSGKKAKGRNCEGLPNGGVMAMDQALTNALRKKGNYKSAADARRSWNGISRWQKQNLDVQEASRKKMKEKKS
jgi:hypothetical protein